MSDFPVFMQPQGTSRVSSGSFRCPMSTAGDPDAKPDSWRKDSKGRRVCSCCGSLSREDAEPLVAAYVAGLADYTFDDLDLKTDENHISGPDGDVLTFRGCHGVADHRTPDGEAWYKLLTEAQANSRFEKNPPPPPEEIEDPYEGREPQKPSVDEEAERKAAFDAEMTEMRKLREELASELAAMRKSKGER